MERIVLKAAQLPDQNRTVIRTLVKYDSRSASSPDRTEYHAAHLQIQKGYAGTVRFLSVPLTF